MNIEQERERFEDAALAHFIAQRAAGKAQDDNGSEASKEALFWRTSDGNYGVKQFNAAWWGWRASKTAGYQLLKDSTHEDRDWDEDSSHDNGRSVCCCSTCGWSFRGHMRRLICRVCATT